MAPRYSGEIYLEKKYEISPKEKKKRTIMEKKGFFTGTVWGHALGLHAW